MDSSLFEDFRCTKRLQWILTMRAALVPGPRVLDLTTGVVCSTLTLSTVTPVLTNIPLPCAEHLDNNDKVNYLGWDRTLGFGLGRVRDIIKNIWKCHI